MSKFRWPFTIKQMGKLRQPYVVGIVLLAVLLIISFMPIKTVECEESVTRTEEVTVEEPYTTLEEYTVVEPTVVPMTEELIANQLVTRTIIFVKYDLTDRENPIISGEWHKNNFPSALTCTALTPTEFKNWNSGADYQACWEETAEDGAFSFPAPAEERLHFIIREPNAPRYFQSEVPNYEVTFSCRLLSTRITGYQDVTKTREVVKYREVTKQVEKQEVITVTKKVNFWKYLFR